MKPLLPLLIALLCPLSLHAEEARVRLRAEGLVSSNGAVRVEVLNVEESWNTEPVRELRLPIRELSAEGVMQLPTGSYGFRLYHDMNDNGELDRNTLGIPLEPIGFSNGYLPSFGPPRLEEYRIPVAEGEQEIVVPLAASTFAQRKFGLGAALVTSFSEYKGGKAVYRPIPFVTYADDYLYVLGPGAGFNLVNHRLLRLEAKARVRFAGFDSDDSPMLEGLHDRQVTVEGGLGARIPLAKGWFLSADLLTDLLGEHGGQSSSLVLSHRFRVGPLMIVPGIGPEWQSSAVNRYYYEVRPSEARVDRPMYSPNHALNLKTGVSVNWSINEDWVVLGIGSLTRLSDEARESPIVEDRTNRNLILGAVYRF